jgi:peptidoglycan/LPS O-acetylase OafA/YrhL
METTLHRAPGAPGYRREIDGLRAIAVLAVVLFHAGFGPAAGFVGVDMFFVISGYLMTVLLDTEWRERGGVDVLAFFARRVRRLFPMLMTIVLATAAASYVVLPPYGELTASLQSAASALVFGANIFFQTHSGGYFDPRSDQMPLLHLWSLGVEEQFYLLWPLLFLAMRRFGVRTLRVTVAILAIASLAVCEVLIATGSQAAFFSLPARWWELALGAGVAWLPRNRSWHPARLAAGGIGLTLIATLLPASHFPGVGALPAVIGAAAILATVHSGAPIGVAGRVLGSPLPFMVGRISYSLYLWHWPLLAFASATHAGPLPALTRATLVLAALVLSAASYRWIETPFRHPSATTTARRLVGTSAFASVAFAFLLLMLGDSLTTTPPPDDLASRTARDHPANQAECHYRGDQAIDPLPRQGCTSDRSLPVKVVIWGDSHALAMQPFAWVIANQGGVAAEGFTRDACAPAVDFDNGKRTLEASRCKDFNARVLSTLRGMDTVVLTASWPDPSDADFGSHFTETIRRLAPTVKHIILLGQTPILPEAAPTCIRENKLDACVVQRDAFDRQFTSSRALLNGLAAKFSNVTYVDPAAFFCDEKRCGAVKDGYGLYWDNNHVSTTAAQHFASAYMAANDKTLRR